MPATVPLLRAGGPASGLAWGAQDGRDAIQGLADPDDGPQVGELGAAVSRTNCYG